VEFKPLSTEYGLYSASEDYELTQKRIPKPPFCSGNMRKIEKLVSEIITPKGFQRCVLLRHESLPYPYIVKDPMLLVEKLKPDPILPQEWEQAEVTALFEATRQRGRTEQRDLAILWLLLHGLRAREAEALNVGDFDGKRVMIREAKDDSVGQVPLLPQAIEGLEGYLNLRRCGGEGVEEGSPLFLSESNRSKGQRLSYWGMYTVVKELAAIARVKNSHPHRGRHTVATEMVSRGIDPLLARQITRHKSEKSFERYSKRALQKQAEEQFLQVFSEKGRQGERGDRSSEPKREAIAVPGLTSADPPDMPLQAATVMLNLRIEHHNSVIGRKLRRASETDCLSRYQLQKAGGEYRLSIPYEDEADLVWQMDWLRGEMAELAENWGCTIKVELREVAKGRRW
jgi:integrase/recombinase XerD